jgi:hypothetical protein
VTGSETPAHPNPPACSKLLGGPHHWPPTAVPGGSFDSLAAQVARLLGEIRMSGDPPAGTASGGYGTVRATRNPMNASSVVGSRFPRYPTHSAPWWWR